MENNLNNDQSKQEEKEVKKFPVTAFSIIALLVSITVFLDLKMVREDVKQLSDLISSQPQIIHNVSGSAVTGTVVNLTNEIQEILDKYK